MTATPLRNEVWRCDLPSTGRRPVVVPSRDQAIPRLRRPLIGPSATTVRGLAGEVVPAPGGDLLARRCAVDLDLVECVSVTTLVERLGCLRDDRLRQVCRALAVAVALALAVALAVACQA
jgi:mRNA interferase MazF